jgi:hypothetical protein
MHYSEIGEFCQRGGPNTFLSRVGSSCSTWHSSSNSFFYSSIALSAAFLLALFFWLPRSLLCSAFTLTTTVVVPWVFIVAFMATTDRMERPFQYRDVDATSGYLPYLRAKVATHCDRYPLLRASFQVSFDVLPHYWHPFWLAVWCPGWLHHPRCISVRSFTNRLVHIAT